MDDPHDDDPSDPTPSPPKALDGLEDVYDPLYPLGLDTTRRIKDLSRQVMSMVGALATMVITERVSGGQVEVDYSPIRRGMEAVFEEIVYIARGIDVPNMAHREN